MSWLFCNDLISWNLSDAFDFSTKLFRHKIHVFHSCSVCLTSPYPTPHLANDVLKWNEKHRSVPFKIVFDWLGLVIRGECGEYGEVSHELEPFAATTWESLCLVSSPQVYYFLYPLRLLHSRCYILLITKLLGSFLCWILELSASLPYDSSTSLLAVLPIPKQAGRWERWLVNMVSPLVTSSPTFLQCETGTLLEHSHLFRDLETHGSNQKLLDVPVWIGDTYFMLIKSIPQDFFVCLRIMKLKRVNNVEK